MGDKMVKQLELGPQRKRPNIYSKTNTSQFYVLLVAFLICLFVTMTSTPTLVEGMELFQVRFVEQDGCRLIATSNYNYGISSPKLLAKSWLTVSVNGDRVYISPASGGQQVTSRSELGPTEMLFIENLRDEIASSNTGYSHVSSASGGASGNGGNFMMSSDGGSFSTGSGGGVSSSFSSSNGLQQSHQTSSSNLFGGGVSGVSYNLRDKNNFSVARSDLPFSWSRVFFNGNLVTFVYKNGDVRMQPLSSLEPSELEAAERIQREVSEMQRQQAQQISNTMQHSMDMVSNVFNSIMGSFPRQPNYQSAVGGMFGNNFPFGPNNSPFSSAGWPFGGAAAGAGGASAVAIAGRRR